MLVSESISLAVQIGSSISFLILAAAGLAVIFGMMNVINLAHGELIMLGAYGTAATFHAGVPLPFAMIVGVAGSVVVGVIIERLFVRRLYHRPFDSMIVTWAVGLILSQGMLILAGPSMSGIGTPLGEIVVGPYGFAIYRLLLIPIALAVLVALFAVFKLTGFGREARATMQDPSMASALGMDVSRIYRNTFAIGAGLAGLAGALFAPTMSIVPNMGVSFIVQAFATVVVGGADVFVGMAPAAVLLGATQALLTAFAGTLTGVIGLLVAVLVTVRILPLGISSLFGRGRR